MYLFLFILPAIGDAKPNAEPDSEPVVHSDLVQYSERFLELKLEASPSQIHMLEPNV